MKPCTAPGWPGLPEHLPRERGRLVGGRQALVPKRSNYERAGQGLAGPAGPRRGDNLQEIIVEALHQAGIRRLLAGSLLADVTLDVGAPLGGLTVGLESVPDVVLQRPRLGAV